MNIRIIRFVVAAGILCGTSGAALAQGNAWYVAGGLGVSFANDVDIQQLGVTISSDLDTGALVTGAVGHTFGGFRAEGELAYMDNDVSQLSVAGLGSTEASGDVSALAFMANVYYDFNADGKWKPFIGAGVGYANVSINNLAAGGFLLADDSAGVFAYQIKVGIGYAFTDSLDGTLGYRYFGTQDADFVDTSGAAFTTDGLTTNVVEVGVRYRF